MSNPPLCPNCGSPISAGSPEQLCPKCVLLAGLESRINIEPAHPALQGVLLPGYDFTLDRSDTVAETMGTPCPLQRKLHASANPLPIRVQKAQPIACLRVTLRCGLPKPFRCDGMASLGGRANGSSLPLGIRQQTPKLVLGGRVSALCFAQEHANPSRVFASHSSPGGR